MLSELGWYVDWTIFRRGSEYPPITNKMQADFPIGLHNRPAISSEKDKTMAQHIWLKSIPNKKQANNRVPRPTAPSAAPRRPRALSEGRRGCRLAFGRSLEYPLLVDAATSRPISGRPPVGTSFRKRHVHSPGTESIRSQLLSSIRFDFNRY